MPLISERGGRGRRVLLSLMLLAMAMPQALAAPFSIDAVKAAYLFRFASYVEWPERGAGGGPLHIGVIGAEDVAVHLERLVTGMTVRGKSVKVRRVRAVDEIAGLHILYVGATVFRSSRPVRLAAVEQPILLVTDSRDGLAGGGVINFIEMNRNLRFEISLPAADRRGLKIDSALLAVAASVEARKK